MAANTKPTFDPSIFSWEDVNKVYWSQSARQNLSKEHDFIILKDDKHFIENKKDLDLLREYFRADEALLKTFLSSQADNLFYPNTLIEYTGDDGKVRYGIAGTLLWNDPCFLEQKEIFILRISNDLQPSLPWIRIKRRTMFSRRNEISNAKYIVEATINEMHYILHEASQIYGLTVEEARVGTMDVIGSLKVGNQDMPVVVTTFFSKINGHLVAFYEPTSQVVDHRMVDAWISKFEAAKLKNKCDASNYAHCIAYCRDRLSDSQLSAH